MVVDRRRAGRDRREARRVQAVFAVKNRMGSRVQLGLAEDIGPGGMTLRRPREPVAPQTPVSLSFELPGQGAALALSGVVVRDAGAGAFRRTGVRFTTLEPDQERLLAAYCAEAEDLRR
jgi:hypothetical protein